MRVMTILGTRPEIIRLSRVIAQLDRLADTHVLVHTGQNYDRRLSDLFFEQLHVRRPDHQMTPVGHSFGRQVGAMFAQVEQWMIQDSPDAVLVLGDTNSALCAVLAVRRGLPVYHMEAGNRCFDPQVPEEMNRRIIDAISTFNLPYTLGARENLLREGMAAPRVWVTGNPIHEVMQYYSQDVDGSEVLKEMGLQPGQYVLATVHRAETVDDPKRLLQVMEALKRVAADHALAVVCSVHPRTRDRLQMLGYADSHPQLFLREPFGFFDFLHLQRHARCVITDSGTVQEESCLLHIPCVVVRRSTERPETVVCGATIISGVETERIVESVRQALMMDRAWTWPVGYGDANVSMIVANYILGGVCHV